MLLVKRRH